MWEYEKTSLSRSSTILAKSEEDAIDKAINDPFFTKEETGYHSHNLRYPLTFKASIINHE